MDDRSLVKQLWDYMCLGQKPRRADCIIGFGCYNEDVARRAAQLYREGCAPWVVFTGGLGRNTRTMWQSSEAARFGRIAQEEGVPAEALILEENAANTGENFIFTRRLLEQRGIPVRSVLAVQKPYMERRLLGAFPIYWPEAEVTVTSWQQSYEEYISGLYRWGRTEEDTIHMIVGDVQRIWVYARKGYQIPQSVPEPVMQAYRELVSRGYTRQLIPE